MKLPPSLSDERLFSSLRDKVIVFIGDSITRYQYLNLAVAIERNYRWPNAYHDDEELPGSVCTEKVYKDFNRFFAYTNKALNGNEMCDCWKDKLHNYENRRYYNPSLNVSLVFTFMGMKLPQLRQDFNEYPFKRICELFVTNSTTAGELKQCSSEILQAAHPDPAQPDHGTLLYNMTKAFLPDVVVVNWGHHSFFRIHYRGGKRVYKSMTGAISKLNRDIKKRVRYIWKSTTPACHHDKANFVVGRCNITTYSDSKPPNLVGNLLVHDHYMELFDAYKVVTTLDAQINKHKRKPPNIHDIDAANNLVDVERAMPLYVDDIHLHCWVNAELNRALLAQLFFRYRTSQSIMTIGYGKNDVQHIK